MRIKEMLAKEKNRLPKGNYIYYLNNIVVKLLFYKFCITDTTYTILRYRATKEHVANGQLKHDKTKKELVQYLHVA